MGEEKSHSPLQQFVNQKTVSLKTRKRDGTWIATPVNIVVEDDHAYIRTWRGSGKSKRLRNFSEIEIAPSTIRGRVTGPYLSAWAQLLTGDEARHAATLLNQKYPIIHGLLVPLVHWIRRDTTEHYRITIQRDQ